jgi:GMP synthase (glutamine-hydrolysing)
MHIGILETGHPPEGMRLGGRGYGAYFERFLEGQGFKVTAWPVVDMEFPPGPDAADGWLITGSKHGAYEDLPFIKPLEALIREIYDREIPLVGICFGHQIIAQALGGKVEKYSGGWSVGPTTYDWQGKPITLNAWHQDQVVERPADATVVASSPFCENAALVYGHRAFTVQAHPEYEADFIGGLIDKRGRGVVPDPLLDAARAKLDQPNDNRELAARIGRFFKDRIAA